MVKIGCTSNGILDDSRFSEPMPWIGIYVVTASAACAIAMATDAFHGFRYRKLWFPCKFFALNATTLTLIGVAVKLAVDLNTSMPRPQDQLAKLSSTAFICTAIGNSMPSLGTMENKELMMNVVALGILVFTVIVNICIQLGTGVIYVFWVEHVVVMFLMVVLFAILISSSFAIPATKYVLDIKYNKKYLVAVKECEANCNPSVTGKLREDLARYWMMAHTCNPQFVMGRLATCTASGAFCLLSAVTLAEAILRSYLMPSCFSFCKGDSDYKWSTALILATQAAAVVGGTIAPATRWFMAIKFRCPKRKVQKCSNNGVPIVENYWVQKLYQMRESPLNLRVCGRRTRKFVHNTKNKALDLCIVIQKATVVLSKIVRRVSVIFVSRLKRISLWCMKFVSLVKRQESTVNSDTDSESRATGKLDLSHYVLHLEGEEELIDVMMQSNRDAIGHWIRMGRKNQPRELTKLLEKLNPSSGFEGIHTFDSYQVPSLDSVEPPNSWALPMVTLTSIAVATCSTIDFQCIKELMKSVHEGLKYVRVVENNIDTKKDLTNIRKAAEIVWVGVDLNYRWLDVDLRQLALKGKSPKDTIQELSDIAKNKFYELRKNDIIGCLKYSPSKWPVKVLAANAMYRICQTLLLATENKSNECSWAMFDNLTAMTTDIMGACLTNLQYVISKKCHQSSIEQREESVRYAILLLGKSEKILEILSSCSSLSSNPEKVACINEWRTLGKEKDQLFYESSTTSSSSPDLYLNIDRESE